MNENRKIDQDIVQLEQRADALNVAAGNIEAAVVAGLNQKVSFFRRITLAALVAVVILLIGALVGIGELIMLAQDNRQILESLDVSSQKADENQKKVDELVMFVHQVQTERQQPSPQLVLAFQEIAKIERILCTINPQAPDCATP